MNKINDKEMINKFKNKYKRFIRNQIINKKR